MDGLENDDILIVDLNKRAIKGRCKGKEGFKRQIEILEGGFG